MFDKCVSTNQHNSKFAQNTKTVSAVDTKLEVKSFNHRLQKTQTKGLGYVTKHVHSPIFQGQPIEKKIRLINFIVWVLGRVEKNAKKEKQM